MALWAVVLAAGSSSRMGRPKAALLHDGRSFLQCAVDLVPAAQPILIVAGAVAPAELESMLDPAHRGRFVLNPGHASGQFSSLVAGAAATPSATSLLIITVDRPRVQPSTIATLVRAHRADAKAIVAPQCIDGDGLARSGHPIILPADLVDALRRADPESETLRTYVRSGRWRRLNLPVDDLGTLENIDSPADYEALAR